MPLGAPSSKRETESRELSDIKQLRGAVEAATKSALEYYASAKKALEEKKTGARETAEQEIGHAQTAAAVAHRRYLELLAKISEITNRRASEAEHVAAEAERKLAKAKIDELEEVMSSPLLLFQDRTTKVK
jgi:hypothetical protein